MADWKAAIESEWLRRSSEEGPGALFPLIAQSFDSREIIAMVDTLLDGRLTSGDRVQDFEQAFARYVGAPYAVMVNSGSSANLLAWAVVSNPKREHRLRPGDEVLVPAVCWSTSVWPIAQMGLKPVFVDSEPRTLNLDLRDARRKITAHTRALMLVHILGNSAPMEELLALAREHGLLLIEDTCESLGSRGPGARALGTYGELGAYSFYYSHHLTTGEGGMVVCHTLEDYDLLRCLRAHGWSRSLSNREELEGQHPDVDPRFLFVNVGYNLRPMEVQGAFGLCQLRRIDGMNRNRVENRERLVRALSQHPRWKGYLEFPEAAPGTSPVWFGFPALLAPPLARHHAAYLRYLSANGVENRPIVSGNFTRQPAIRLLGIDCDPRSFPGAERINEAGFFIGLHTDRLEDATIARLVDVLLGYEF